MSVDSTELSQLVVEAEDIAQSVSHKLTSAHLLLACFTFPNRAQVLLRERGVDEDVVLGVMSGTPREREGLAREVLDRAREIASGCSSKEADCGHLLIAVTRIKDCLALDLLLRCRVDVSGLRNTALSYYTGGHMPRRLTNLERPVPLPPPPSMRGYARPSSVSAPAPTIAPAAERALPQEEPEVAPRLSPEAAPEVEARGEPFTSRIEPLPTARPQPQAPLRPPSAGGRYELSEKDFPWLTSLGRNLTQLAHAKQIDPVIGRDREIDEIIDILGKRRTNNPVLLGEPGVGKTAVVEGTARRLLELSERGLGERIVVELDMASVVAGTQLRGSFSEKLNGIKEEVRRAGGKVVVFIDEIHTLIGAGSTGEGPQDAANELKSALARGDFPCIGATTHDEYRKFIAQDPALERRFTPVVVREPTVAETEQILAGIVGRYEEHHGVGYEQEALKAAAALAAKYVSDRFLPDKAISIIDLAGSRARREGETSVSAQSVARIVSRLAGVPEERLLLSDSDRLLKLEAELATRVIGHGEPIGRVARVVRRNYAGFASRRPMGSFLFMGPTGVGKTELARALAEVLFGGREAMVRVDMSECSEAHGVARLVGAPPGYVGYGDAGQLTEPVRKRPSSVVLLDEVEKAHRDVLMLLLQVLEEGRLTDGKGRHIDFSNTAVILTTNLGAESFSRTGGPLGFGASASGDCAADERALSSVRKQLPAELWNRLDEKLVFRPLQEEEISRIATLLLRDSSSRLETDKGIGYEAGQDVIAHLVRNGGFDVALGARPMRQAVQRLVEAPLADAILQRRFTPGDRVRIQVRDGALAFDRA
ncbi:MAG: ATP-dependent Clp protease ATP-binding subunit [Deltaproteobacteria bacterium]|nr:ATP-dependent Clp protease ATP-binding subunit [Deltaproteobacteria bacterium]